MDIIRSEDLDRVMDTDKRYIGASNSPNVYWHFCQHTWQRLDEEGYGPFLCSEAQIVRWESQFAQEEGREEMTFHELMNPAQTLADCDDE
tara:strand:- start:3964 stop:4233 length:270 start_codon:yes stop_codon:yes gene_type:complete